ncbi:MAG: hypothetical protein MUC96_02235 [Myxococcaceae bacterium]|nr:hypothetical protein [Myxococcaceae bacterium]
MPRLFLLGLVLVSIGCRHLPRQDEVVNDDVRSASELVADAFVADLKTHPELPPAFTSPDAHAAYRRGLENDFARANGADQSTIGPGLAQAIEALGPTPAQKQLIAISAQRAGAASFGTFELGATLRPFVGRLIHILISLPFYLLK